MKEARLAFGLTALLVLACIARAQLSNPSSTAASTTAPLPPIAELIGQLASDQWQERESAQQRLVALGPGAIDALTAAANRADADPETRTRAAAALVAIHQLDTDGPTLLTMHFKDAPAQQVLDSIEAQAHTRFNTEGFLLPPSRTLSVEADRRPFWEVMGQVCTELGLAPTYEDRSSNQIRLQRSPQNWLTRAPHQFVGPFVVSVLDVHRSRRIDLTGTRGLDDRFGVQMVLNPEPKVTVTTVSRLDLRAATDDAGNSLLPPTGAAAARFISYGSSRPAQQIEVPLLYPEKPGSRITVLRGRFQVGIGQDIRRFQVDELLGTMKVTTPIADGPAIEVQASKSTGDTCILTVTLKRNGQPLDRWQAMTNHVANIALEDSDGNRMSTNGWSGSGGDDEFKYTGHYRQTQFPARFGQALGPKRLGEPTRLVWDVPTKVKTIKLDIEFRDLPMP